MKLSRRSLIAAGAALPFLRVPARAAATSGTLVFGLSSYPPNLFPWANAGTAAATAKLAMFRGLLGYDPKGEVRGELAESWERDEKDGAWVFHLRAERRLPQWRSGDLGRCRLHHRADRAGHLDRLHAHADAERRACRDARQADGAHHTKQPVVTFPQQMASYFMPICAKGSADNGGEGIGAGPFVMTSNERGVSLEFKPFDKYYRAGLPKLGTIKMIAYKDENLRVAALQSGNVDLIEYVPWQSMESIDQNAKLELQTTDGPFMYLTFNGAAKPFGDPRVRRAIAHAIRREDIVKAAFYGRGSSLEGLPLAKGSAFYDDKLAHAWGYDPAKAKALLKEAGVGEGFTCKLLSTAQYGMHKDTATVIQQHLAEVGIGVELVLPDWATRVSLGNRGQYEFAVMGSAAESNDPDGLTPFLAGNLAASYVRSFHLDIPKLDKLLDDGRAEFDEKKRHAIYDEMQHVALEEAPMVGLCWRSQGYGLKKTVEGFQNMPGALTFYSGTTLEETSVA